MQQCLEAIYTASQVHQLGWHKPEPALSPHLQTPRLILRQIRLTDTPAVFDILADAEVARYYDEDPFTHLSQANQLIEFWASAFERQQVIRWGIERRDDGRLIGTCGYYGWHAWHLRAALGYELAHEHWRQGIMTQALRTVIAFGFEQAGLNRIQADVMPTNQAYAEFNSASPRESP